MYKKITFFEGVTKLKDTSPRWGLAYGVKDHTLQTKISGTGIASVSIKLEGSIKGETETDWFTLEESTNTSGETIFIKNKFVDMIRVSYEVTLDVGGHLTSLSVYYIGG